MISDNRWLGDFTTNPPVLFLNTTSVFLECKSTNKRMRKHFPILLLFSFLYACSIPKNSIKTTHFLPEKQLQILTQKALKNLDLVEIDSMNIPRTINEDGSIHGVKSNDWTSGFYAGTHWELYRFSKEERLKDAAIQWTAFQKRNVWIAIPTIWDLRFIAVLEKDIE